MQFSAQLVPGKLIRRYKRFLADVQLSDGGIVTAHCTNSGSMKTCLEENAEVYLSPNQNPKRKTKYTWELIRINNSWIGINTLMPNKLAKIWLQQQVLQAFPVYDAIKSEYQYTDSRIDLYAENQYEKCLIEVKNVTMKCAGYARFPDAPTTRGQKHLRTLIKAKSEGYRAVMLYIIQRTDVEKFAPADQIDPDYAFLMQEAYKQGVEIIPARVQVTPKALVFDKILPFDFSTAAC